MQESEWSVWWKCYPDIEERNCVDTSTLVDNAGKPRYTYAKEREKNTIYHFEQKSIQNGANALNPVPYTL